jgi:hypothetical protein
MKYQSGICLPRSSDVRTFDMHTKQHLYVDRYPEVVPWRKADLQQQAYWEFCSKLI